MEINLEQEYKHWKNIQAEAGGHLRKINKQLCKERYGFTIGDTVKLSPEFVQALLETNRDDEYFIAYVYAARHAIISACSFENNLVILVIQGYTVSTTVEEVKEMQNYDNTDA